MKKSQRRQLTEMQRLERLHAHLCPRAALQRSLATGAEPAADEDAGLKLLTDRQLKDFLIDGVAVIPVRDLSEEWHSAFYAKATEQRSPTVNRQNRPRRNVWEDMPEITQICRTPTVRGALTSILGRDYVMHPHRALHTGGGTGDQGFRTHPAQLQLRSGRR